MPELLVVGLDVGGSTTRAAVVSADGAVRGTGRASGGNPTSHGAEIAAGQLRIALTAALAGLDAGLVRAGAIGLAGAGRLLAEPAGRAAFDRAWWDAGLRCRYDVYGDALVAYAAGTDAPDGTILISGTGAIAAEVRDLALVRTADGHGWLLGDAGSGFWIGREAVRHTLAELDRQREPDPLGRRVLVALLGSTEVADPPRRTVNALVQAVTLRPPVELSRLAPLVLATAGDGDVPAEPESRDPAGPPGGDPAGQNGHDPAGRDVARRILTDAAGHLVASVGRIRPAGADTPLVLGGGLLAGDTALAREVRAAVAGRWPRASVSGAGDGALGAAWLAARTLPEIDDPADLRQRLFAGRPSTDAPG